jgi:hypothetical protein
VLDAAVQVGSALSAAGGVAVDEDAGQQQFDVEDLRCREVSGALISRLTCGVLRHPNIAISAQ